MREKVQPMRHNDLLQRRQVLDSRRHTLLQVSEHALHRHPLRDRPVRGALRQSDRPQGGGAQIQRSSLWHLGQRCHAHAPRRRHNCPLLPPGHHFLLHLLLLLSPHEEDEELLPEDEPESRAPERDERTAGQKLILSSFFFIAWIFYHNF